MTRSKLIGAAVLLAFAIAAPSVAGQRSQGRGAPSQGSAGRAVPRGSAQGAPPAARPAPGRPGAPPVARPAPGAPGRVYGYPGRPYGYGYPYRPYGYPYRPYGYYPRYYYGYPYYGYPGLSFYFGFGYPFGFSASFGYPYPAYGYYPYGYYPYGYTYPPPGYTYPPQGYSYPAPSADPSGTGVAVTPPTGSGIRLDIDPADAEVYVDGNYAGRAGDFATGSQRLDLAPDRHRIELHREGFEPVSFEVNVEPGRTQTYRSHMRPVTR